MKKYSIKLELLSPALIGSGVGFGANIDTDVVFDDLGVPYVPAKRIKGCLLDSAMEIKDMFFLAGINTDDLKIESTFGKIGSENEAPVYFSNLYIEDYQFNKDWLNYFAKSENYKGIVTFDRILNAFTEIRQQTQIDDNGIARDNSLRTIRVLRKGLTFYGDVFIDIDDERILNTLLFACLNFRHFGTKRNRGFGEVQCSLLTDGNVLSINGKLEVLCTA